MNIDINPKLTTSVTSSGNSGTPFSRDEKTSFAKELSNLEEEQVVKNTEKVEEENTQADSEENLDVNESIYGLEGAVAEMNEKVNQTDEIDDANLKNDGSFVDKTAREENSLINNDMNIYDPNDPSLTQLGMQMGANMSFNSNGQPFSEFLNEQKGGGNLSSSEKDLAEERAIMSTMEENMAIARKNMLQEDRIKVVSNSEGVRKVDKETNLTIETVVKYDSVIMTKADVDFFAKLVESGQMEINSQDALKSSQVSKTLADLISKSMKDNQPVRIDFDNGISVIIKISREGKISADFLPSTQIAEAYLKENLPLLKQKFDDNNIEYDELNHRHQKQDEKNNRKKEQKDE